MAGDKREDKAKFVPSEIHSIKPLTPGDEAGEPSPGGPDKEPSPEDIDPWALFDDPDAPPPAGGEGQPAAGPTPSGPKPPRATKRPSKRQITDKRGLRYGVLYTTSETISPIEDWLEENCLGKWSLELVAMDDDLVRKRTKILFELDSDKQAFRERIDQDNA